MRFTSQQWREKQIGKMKPGQSYPSSIIQSINSVIKECAASSGLFPTQANPSQYLAFFFDYGEDYYIPDNAFLCIWYNLIQFHRLGKSDWIKSYWETAVCHANLHLNGYYWQVMKYPLDSPKEKLLFRFQEFHQMYCAYLLSNKEYELVKHLRDYSNSSPYLNSLVESDFFGMCKHLEYISNPMYMDIHYSFYTVSGVTEGTFAKNWYSIYLLLSCLIEPKISLELDVYDISLRDLAVCERVIFDLIQIDKSNSAYKGIVEDINFKKIFGITKKDFFKLTKRLKSLLDFVRNEISQKRGCEQIDPDIIESFKNSVNSLVKSSIKTNKLPVKYDCNHTSGSHQLLNIPAQLIERNYFSDEQLISYVNFPETYASYVYRLINITYTRQFKLNTPRASFNIDFSEIEQALTILGIDEAYSIIAFGVTVPDISVFKTVPIHFINAQYSELAIIPTEELPYLALSQSLLNINVEKDDERKEYMKIKSQLTYSFEQPRFIHYIKLRVVFRDYQGIPSQLSKIQVITDYL